MGNQTTTTQTQIYLSALHSQDDQLLFQSKLSATNQDIKLQKKIYPFNESS